MNGTTHDEIRFHLVGDSRFGSGDSCNFTSSITAATYMNALNVFFGRYASYDAGFYPSPNTDLAANTTFTAMRTDGAMACTALMMDKWLAAKSVVYAYEFSDANAPNTATGPVKLQNGGKFPLGAYHVAELQYLFPHTGTVACGLPYAGLSAPQKNLAAAMVTYWTQFATVGNPNPPAASLPIWPRYSAASPNMLSLLGGGPKLLAAASFDAFHKCSALWGPVVSQ